MEPITSGKVLLTQGQTYYETYGEKGEWVVCLHGITFWSFSFHAVVPKIVENGYRVLLFDFFGRGNSDAPSIVYNLDLYISQTKQLLDHLKISEEKFNLIGFSMGGCVAGGFALAYPHLLSKLIFIAPAVVPIELPFVARLITVPYIGRGIFNMMGKSAMLQKLRTERLRDDFAYPEKVPEVIDQSVKRVEWIIEEKEGFLHAFHSTLYNMPLGQSMLDKLSAIAPHINVYILWGDMDKIVPVAGAPLLQNIFNGSKCEIIKECGHSCLLEKPEECAQHIVAFLNDKEQR